jgi:hypothetical protein
MKWALASAKLPKFDLPWLMAALPAKSRCCRHAKASYGPQKYSTQPISVSFSHSENDQKRNGFGTVWLSDYSACGHTNLKVEFVTFMRGRDANF